MLNALSTRPSWVDSVVPEMCTRAFPAKIFEFQKGKE